MNEQLLKETLETINYSSENSYPSDASTNLFDKAQNTLINVDINFKKIPKKNFKKQKNPYLLRLFDHKEAFLDFNKGFYPNNTKLGKFIANDKYLSEQFLKYSNIKTPETKLFKSTEYDKAEQMIKNGDGYFVIKPKSLSNSLGAFRDVDITNFKSCWSKTIDVQKKRKIKSPIVIIQNQVEGLELRITVNEGIVDTATIKAPGFVVGDGQSTIEELIKKKNEQRKKNVYQRKNLLKIHDELITDLKSRGLTLTSTLKNKEYLILYPKTNLQTGREHYEVTQFVHPNVMQQAVDSVIATPGVHTAGVDIIIDSLSSTEGTVIEVNQNPAFQLNYYPKYGKIQDPLKEIFNNLKLEKRILNKELNIDTLDQDTLNFLMERYEFLYKKQRTMENGINALLND